MNETRIAGVVVALAAIALLGLLGGWPVGACTEMPDENPGEQRAITIGDEELSYSPDNATSCSVELWHLTLLSGLGVLGLVGLAAAVRG